MRIGRGLRPARDQPAGRGAGAARSATRRSRPGRDALPLPEGDRPVVDGILFDEAGNAVAYYVLKRHPGEVNAFGSPVSDCDLLPAEAVIHLFRPERPGQSRGIPEITPA
ncbi:MAG TPA: phage portal protein, partial [Planctomycetaceae bacterium]|nr:phage portal protein [Planctomycetaceae bacterium]